MVDNEMDLSTSLKPRANLRDIPSSLIDCYHCGLPVSHKNEFVYDLAQQTQSFCCAGCQAVAALIHQGGLDQFYKYRSCVNKIHGGQRTNNSKFNEK